MKNTLKTIGLTLLPLLGSFSYCQQKVAVTEFAGSGVEQTTANNITNRFSYELSKTKKFDMVEREMMNKILDELKFQSSGCVADECAVEIGQMVGVQQIIAGSVSKIETLYSLNIRLIDVATGEIIYQDMDDMEGSVTEFIRVTIKNMALRMAAEMATKSKDASGGMTEYSTTAKGSVVFNVNKSNVAIFVDGRYSSRSSGQKITLSLAEGNHNIKLSLDGYKDWEKSVNIIADETLEYSAELVSGFATSSENITTGILLVRSEPSDAKVFVDGVEKGHTLLQIADIGIGEHEIRIEKKLYYPYTEIVTIQPDAIVEVNANLKANFGALSITSVPEKSILKINGQTKGRTPVTIAQLESGTCEIELSKELYHAYTEKFVITDGSINNREIKLTPAFGKLKVVSQPQGATVYIDGQSKGKTPFELDELPSGNYSLKLTYPLYETIEEQITVNDGETNMKSFILGARSGILSVLGSPAAATVFVNGQKIGKLPIHSHRIAEGMVEVKVEATDYHSKTEYLNIYRDKSYSPKIELVRHTGKLIVITTPPDATVLLNDKNEGKTPKILNEVWTGSHNLKVTHPSFLTQTKNFNLMLDEKKEFRFELMTYEGSIQEDIDKAKKNQKFYLITSVVSGVIGYGLSYFAEMQYDNYLSTQSKSDSDNSMTMVKLSDVGSPAFYSIAGFSGVMGLKFTVDISGLMRKLDK